MNAFINYLIEANIGLCLFLFLYWVLLKNETEFSIKRVILLCGIGASILFPAFHLTVYDPAIPTLHELLPANLLPEIIIHGSGVASVSALTIHAWRLIASIYSIGVLFFSLLFIVRVSKLLRLMITSVTYSYQHFIVAESAERKPTFSFFHFVFIGQAQSLSAHEKLQILQHESVHVRQWHSVDSLLLELLGIIFWFNPLLIIYKKIFVQLHEFEADARAVESHEVNEYCSLLARAALQSADFTIANHFNQSLTLKRIAMMQTVKRKLKMWKVAASFAALSAFFILVACQEQPKENTATEKNSSDPIETNKIYTVVDKQPEYAGGMDAMREHITKNMSYPADAVKAKIEGTSFVSFVVNTDGLISDVQIVKGLRADCDEEAKRVIELMPKWIPGQQDGKNVNVRFVVPIRFALS